MNIEIQEVCGTEQRCENCNNYCVGICLLAAEVFSQEERCGDRPSCRHWEAIQFYEGKMAKKQRIETINEPEELVEDENGADETPGLMIVWDSDGFHRR